MSARSEQTKDGISLNRLLKKLGLENYSIDNEGTPLTRFDQLAKIIWDRALGYTEMVKDKEIIHKPERSFICMIYDRVEGKIPTTNPVGDDDKASLADRVSDQTKSRLNSMAEDNE